METYHLSEQDRSGAPEVPAHGSGAPPLVLEIDCAGRSRERTIEGVALLGRRDAASGLRPQIDLSADDAVSRRHLLIAYRDGRYRARDLGSTNGTLLNGQPLAPDAEVALQTGDELEMGAFTRVRIVEAPVTTPAVRTAPAPTAQAVNGATPAWAYVEPPAAPAPSPEREEVRELVDDLMMPAAHSSAESTPAAPASSFAEPDEAAPLPDFFGTDPFAGPRPDSGAPPGSSARVPLSGEVPLVLSSSPFDMDPAVSPWEPASEEDPDTEPADPAAQVHHQDLDVSTPPPFYFDQAEESDEESEDAGREPSRADTYWNPFDAPPNGAPGSRERA